MPVLSHGVVARTFSPPAAWGCYCLLLDAAAAAKMCCLPLDPKKGCKTSTG